MSPRSRRQITGQQKVEIVKRHLVDGVPVSTLCEEYKIQPTQFYTWQKQLFENGEKAFEKAFCGFGEEADRQARSQTCSEERIRGRTSRGARQAKKGTWGTLTGQWVSHDVRNLQAARPKTKSSSPEKSLQQTAKKRKSNTNSNRK